MRGPENGFERRDFLKTSLLAAAGTTALGQRMAAAAAPAEKAIAIGAATLPTRKFGKTGHTLPILGMGGSAMVRLFASSYGVELLPVDDRIKMVRHAYDSGIRYFDTARVYGESESIMGRGLKGVRDNVYLATKCHVPEPDQVRKCVETSLAQLDTDYVDCVQIHSPAIERVGFEGGMKLHAELVKLRDEKMLRFIGLTTHVAFEDVLKMLSTGGFDQVLLAYGYFRRGMDTILSNPKVEYRDMCLAKAADFRHGDRGDEGHGREHLQPQLEESRGRRRAGAIAKAAGGRHPLGAARPAGFDVEYRRVDAIGRRSERANSRGQPCLYERRPHAAGRFFCQGIRLGHRTENEGDIAFPPRSPGSIHRAALIAGCDRKIGTQVVILRAASSFAASLARGKKECHDGILP